MSNVIISSATYNFLVQHLVNIEDEKANVINEFYPDETKEKKEFENLMDDYISSIESFLRKASNNNQAEFQLPFITIGSIVEIMEVDSGELSTIQVVSPFFGKTTFDADCASYLSPVGRALLLKKVNDKVNVSTPIGEFTYTVKSIKHASE
ncbi:MAG TPA: GreA/GreB family elongation factor [Clostridiaceae bacterium]|nr:GreA/GreB family elongation factor [Clostridiaceae bacterium]